MQEGLFTHEGEKLKVRLYHPRKSKLLSKLLQIKNSVVSVQVKSLQASYPSNQEAKGHKGSNQKCLEALEGSTTRIYNILDEVSITLAELMMVLNATTHESEENRRAIEAMRYETNASLEKFERMVVETNG